MNMEVGIYKITNTINGKVYIGQSQCITKRWKNHKITAYNSNDRSYEYPLYRAIRKYGIENFDFSILENCTIEQLDEREIFWIKFYSSDNSCYGYNNDSGGSNCPHPTKLTEEKVNEIINLLKNTTISQYDLAERFKVDQFFISNINLGKSWTKDDITYPIRDRYYYLSLKKFQATKNYCIDCGCEISQKAIRCVNCYQKTQRKKDKPSREELKTMIRTLPFTQIGNEYGVTDNAIRKWCDSYNLPRRRSDINKISDADWNAI